MCALDVELPECDGDCGDWEPVASEGNPGLRGMSKRGCEAVPIGGQAGEIQGGRSTALTMGVGRNVTACPWAASGNPRAQSPRLRASISSSSFKYPVPPALLGPCLQTSPSPARRDVRLRLPHRPRCYFRRALHWLWRLMRVRLYSSVRVRYTLTPSLSQCLRRPQHAGLQLLQAISTRCLVVQVLGAFPTFIRARHVP